MSQDYPSKEQWKEAFDAGYEYVLTHPDNYKCIGHNVVGHAGTKLKDILENVQAAASGSAVDTFLEMETNYLGNMRIRKPEREALRDGFENIREKLLEQGIAPPPNEKAYARFGGVGAAKG